MRKNPLNNLFPNGEYTTIKPIMDFEGICRICNSKAKLIEFEL